MKEHLIHQLRELDLSYQTLNAGDANRRFDPRVNEPWADAGNKAV